MNISIITVTYNCAHVVADCLDSVAGQTHADVEHVVIDGASTDGTSDVLQAHRDSLAVLVSEPDGGIYDAMNKGITLATGDIIGFLNSDDFYAGHTVLSTVAKVFESDPTLDACYSDLIYVDLVDTFRTVRYWQSSDSQSNSFAKGWMPPHPTFFVRRSVYERYGVFNLDYRIAADVELMMRFLEFYKIRVRYVPEVWVKMRLGGTTNKSFKNIWIQNQEVLRALKEHNLPVNAFLFFARKLFSRGQQFFRRPVW